MAQKTAIILGATGLIGSFCLTHLLDDNNYSKIISLHRKRINKIHPKFEQHIIDFDSAEDYIKYFKADDIFCCLGTTIKTAGSQAAFRKVDLEYVIESARFSAQNGAQQFLVVSSIGADAASGNFYLRTKGEMEEALKKIAFKNIHIFRPSMLLGPRKEFRLGENIGKVAMKMFAPFMFGSLKKYKAIEAETVALAMIKAANQPGAKAINVYESDEIEEMVN